MHFSLEFERWEDGKKVTRRLEAPDRWEVHSAERVTVCLDDLCLTVVQQPTSLTAQKVGVGACLWDGALLLAGYLAAMPRHKLVGAKCIELGAGVGAVAAAAAAMGAHVVVTDIAKVLPLLEENMRANGVLRGPSTPLGAGYAEVEELEWGQEGWMKKVATLADPPPDLVLAADCCYVDGDGASPSTAAFVETCAGLCGDVINSSGSKKGGKKSKTKVLVAFERRSPEVRRCFIEEAQKTFKNVNMVPMARLPPPFRLEYCDLWELSM